MPPSGEHLLSIGEFSRLSMISVRMLRHYDEHDVLHPTRTDPVSGYRRYSADLLRTARQVRELRDVGLGVAQLAECVPSLDDAEALRSVLERQRTTLASDAAAVAHRLREVDRLIERLEEPVMSVEITRRTLPARTVASVRDTIPTYADEGNLWGRLMGGLAATGAAPTEDPRMAAVFHDDDYVESGPDVEVQLDVVGPFESAGGVECVQLPEQDVAVGVLRGPYDGIGAVMEGVGSWIADHGLRLAGPMFNLYLVSPQQAPDPADWVTEVCIPVAPAPEA